MVYYLPFLPALFLTLPPQAFVHLLLSFGLVLPESAALQELSMRECSYLECSEGGDLGKPGCLGGGSSSCHC